MPTTTDHQFYARYIAATAADDAWHAAIKRAFPRERAGDVRYEARAKGEHGTELRAAYDARVAALGLLQGRGPQS